MQFKALRGLVWENATPFNQMTWGSNSINDASASVSHFFRGGRDDMAKDPEVIKWLETADSSIDPEVRKANYKKALEKIAEQVDRSEEQTSELQSLMRTSYAALCYK